MTDRSPSRSCSLPEWLKPGVWVRNKLSPHQPRAFVMFVDTEHCKGGFQYHFEKPFKWHVRDEGWQTGGTVFPIGVEHWELAPSETRLTAADYEEVLADHRRLVREIDVLLNGEAGAAKQASLCDLIPQIRELVEGE